jgi:hypothetical protein
VVVALVPLLLFAIATNEPEKLNHETWNNYDFSSIFYEKLSW